MSVLVICIIMTACIVYVWDVLHFPQEIFDEIIKVISKGKLQHIELKKPFSCSLCISFWCSLVLLLIMLPEHSYFALVSAFSTKYINYTFSIIDAIISKIFVLLERLINKL